MRRPWRQRKEEQLAAIAGAPEDVCALKAADCLHNLTALTRDLRARGRDALARFNAGPAEIYWYNETVVEHVSPRLGDDHALATELRQALGDFRQELDALR